MRTLRAMVAGLFLAGALIAPSSGVAQTAGAAAHREEADTQLTSLLFKTKAGLTLNYVQQGDPKGPVIVLLHGAGDSWHSYDRVYPLIPQRYLVYGITMRGHGLSDHPETGFTAADFAGDIMDFLEQKNIRHATLVGHSLGSFVAQKVAELDSEPGEGHLDRLVLIGSGPGISKKSLGTAPVLSAFSQLKDPIPYAYARDFQASTIYSPVPAANFEMWVAEAMKVPAATWHGLAGGHGSPEDLGKIRILTLVLWGEKDSIFSKADEDMLMKMLPNAKFSAYAETGHALHWERPERFTQELLAFIQAAGRSVSTP